MIYPRSFSTSSLFPGFSFRFLRTGEEQSKPSGEPGGAFSRFYPPFLVVLFTLALSIALLPEKTIATFLGERSGFLGYLIASVVGAITLVPGFVAFPMARVLLNQGAGVAQMAVFISTLMMVGIVTFPLEVRYFGVKAAAWRNFLAYCYSFLVGYTVWLFVRMVR